MKKFIFFLFTFCFLTSHLTYSQWYKQTIPVNKPIIGIEFKDSLTGWAVTSPGSQFDVSYILNTTNGGTNWLLQYTGTDYAYDAFDMVDMNTGYIIGGIISSGLPSLIKTTNGGVNWIVSNPGVGIAFDDIFFPSNDSGFICASNSFAPGLWFTSNGGASWQVRTNGLVSTAVSTLFFLNNNTGWCGTPIHHLAKTTNAGLNWTQLTTFTEPVFGITFNDIMTGWVGLAGGKIASTVNGSINWSIIKPFPADDNVYDIYMNNQVGWAGTAWFGKIFKTTNGGANWGYQDDSCGSTHIWFMDTLIGWIGYLSIGIGHTTNGGGPIFYTGLVSNSGEVPSSYKLYQNYPNPFNPYTTIKLDVYRGGPVSLYIYDILGKELYSIPNQNLTAGTYEFNWDSRGYSSGVYICRAITKDFSQSNKMILSK